MIIVFNPSLLSNIFDNLYKLELLDKITYQNSHIRSAEIFTHHLFVGWIGSDSSTTIADDAQYHSLQLRIQPPAFAATIFVNRAGKNEA